MTDEFLKIARMTEEEAREMLESIRWPNGAVCPKCGSDKGAYKLQSKPESKHKIRPGVYKCKSCRKKFTVTVGTIFEDSHIPLDKWMIAIYLMNASKKGISAHQLHRMLDITYKAAWFMCHRIRFAMSEGPLSRLLHGKGDRKMIFSKGLDDKVRDGTKTQTRRLVKEGDSEFFKWHNGLFRYDAETGEKLISRVYRNNYKKWMVGHVYAIQSGRGKKGNGYFRIVKIRKERVQDISVDDVIAEGAPQLYFLAKFHPQWMRSTTETIRVFRRLWNSIHKKPPTRWEDNPEVYVLEIEPVGVADG